MRESTSQRLKEIMDLRGIKQIDIVKMAQPYCKQYGIKLGRNDLSQYVSGKAEPTQNKLFVLSKALNINVAWLMGLDVSMNSNDTSVTCPDCEFVYCPDNKDESEHHAKRHKQYINAIKKYGFWLSYKQRESTKLHSYEILNSEKSTITEKIVAAEDICKAYFSRSISAVDFDSRHPDFEEYASMLLNQHYFKKQFEPVYDKLVEKYGVRSGLVNGHTYFNCDTKNNKPDNAELEEDVIMYHRDGKTVRKKMTKEQIKMLAAMIDALPEDDNPDL